MNISRINLPRGPISVHLTIEGTQGRPYTVALLDSPDLTTATVYYERHKLTDREINFNLRSVPKTPYILLTRGELKMYFSGPMRSPNIPYRDATSATRPYSLEEIKLVPNTQMTTPARMFTNKPIIEFNPDYMRTFSPETRRFIMLHELGHYYHDNEEKADGWAAVEFLNTGGNLSTAIYALTGVLGRTPENVQRMITQHSLLKKISREYYG